MTDMWAISATLVDSLVAAVKSSTSDRAATFDLIAERIDKNLKPPVASSALAYCVMRIAEDA